MLSADPVLVILSLSSIGYLVLIAAVLRSREINQPTTRLLAVFILAALGWSIEEILLRLQQVDLTAAFDLFVLHRLSLYIQFGLAVLFLWLTHRFERKPGLSLAWWGFSGFVLAAALVLYENPFHLPGQIQVTPGLLLLREPAAFDILVTGWIVLAAGSIYLSWKGLRKTISPLHRNRNLYWSTAAILAAAGQALFLFRQVIPGSLFYFTAITLASYVMLTHDLPDLRSVFRSSASYLAVTFLAAVLYLTGFFFIQLADRRIPGFDPFLGGVILAVSMAAFAIPLLSMLQRVINRTMQGSFYDPHQMLSEYSQTISNIIDLDYLAAVAVSRICEAMDLTRGALITVHIHPGGDVLIDEPASEYILRPVTGYGQKLPEGRLAGKCSLVAALSRGHFPITQYDIDLLPQYKDLTPIERTWIDRLNMDVYVPVYSKDTWIGVMAMGPKKSGDRYFNEDLSILQTLADQTAIALENARLYDNLKQRNAENERLNQDLRAANAELARLDEAKSDFINIASHELRTPLTQVLGYNDILNEMIRTNSLEATTGLMMVDSVRKAARRLEEIVEMMFDVTKLESRTLDLHCAPVSLASIITVAIDTWMKGIEDRKQSISVHGLANLPAVMADGKRLIQAFSNLIQNAIKSTHDGGQIRITGRVAGPGEVRLPPTENGTPRPPDQIYVEIVVTDTGIGIAEEDLERIFIKFYRVGSVLLHSSGETKFKGAGPGLGLTIARGIVEAHGGWMWAESPGYDETTCPGSSFHVVLPVFAQPEAP